MSPAQAVIFGLLKIADFAHGARSMPGAFIAWMPLNYSGLEYWRALVIAPLALGVGVFCMDIGRVLLARIYRFAQKYSKNA